uniref:recombinase family protein n=1 Tax=Leclercia adecarboxylata TaxID=83655 RepID=UPI0038D3FF87
MKIGYARKSTHLQDVAHQVDELTKAGCEQIYQDQTSRSGPKRDKKGAPELENCLKALREGDTLVVWALDGEHKKYWGSVSYAAIAGPFPSL